MVSIIVPVYNVEKYLDRCVNSVLVQSYKAWELLLIDDGSADSSGILCDDLAKKDSRVRVFHKKNSGVSSARNLGIEESHGDFLMFLDSDDFWKDEKVLETLVNKISSYDLDIVRGEYYRVDASGHPIQCQVKQKNIDESKLVYDSFEMVKNIIDGEFFSVLFLIKKNVLQQLRFDESLVFGEDMNLLINMFCQKLKCGYIPLQFYAYRQLVTSASKRVNLLNIINSFGFCDKFYICALKTTDERLSNLYVYNSIMMYYWTLETVASDQYFSKYKEIDKILCLKKLQCVVRKRTKLFTGENFPIQIYVSPLVGVYLFRLRWKMGNILRRLRLR